MDEIQMLKDKIKEQQDIIDKLKEEQSPKTEVDDAIIKSNEAFFRRLALKTPKGTQDYGPVEMSFRLEILEKVTNVFLKHGAQAMDTPVFELTDVLVNKYGDDSKLIYDLADQGGERLSLRYDLTVPFARYLAMNKITNMKRYHIAKVYRRDSPAMNRGRFREFLQCDLDIAGVYDSMVPDVECVRIISDVMETLNITEYLIKVNHRQILEAIFETCGVPAIKFKTIASSIDKLDRLTWKEVEKEMIEVKGLNADITSRIRSYVTRFGEMSILEGLAKDREFMKVRGIRNALDDMKLFFTYAQAIGVLNKVQFNLSLARGLDYYTGIIFEAILTGAEGMNWVGESLALGSVAAGGRYDNLISSLDVRKSDVPCVGLSIGVERLFSYILTKETPTVKSETHVFVISAHKGLMEEKMKILNELWRERIKAEFSYKDKTRVLDQLQYCEAKKIPLAVIIGSAELQRNMVKIRYIVTREENEVERDNMIRMLKRELRKTYIDI